MDFVEIELEIMEYWDKINLLKTCLEARKDAEEFIFLEGPPTANGLPGAHHVLARAIKDVFCRYKNLLGYKVPRKAGWDCHGLPVELEVEKELGLKTKSEIIQYGIKEFNDLCKKDVFKYLIDWDKLTKRMAFLIDLDDPYVTLKNEYIESVWWSLSEIWKKGLLFNDYTILPLCPRCETSLSSHEVALGYKKIEEDSIYVKFKSKDFGDAYYLVWTTTPWTLTSNIALAVSPDIDYVMVEYKGEKLILAEKRLSVLGNEKNYKIIQKIEGANLEGKMYEPLLNYFEDKKGFFIVSGNFVSTEEGTGIVHIAPAFGEDDFNICKEYQLPIIEPIHVNGHFDDSIPELDGIWFKDSDKIIMEKLREENKLFKTELYAHDYPFCWRCHTPLMYYAKKSWFINMVEIKDKLVELNQEINWVPKFLKDGRFGNFLDNIRNWALSRERFWGTPLPIWKCDSCGYEDCIGSLEELKTKSEQDLQDIDLHKPMIDEVKLICPKCKSEMTRVPEVIDCWYDSGAAFLAQWHYPFENEEKFRNSFPVDFISEAIDQTRGWFYTLHAISTLLFEKISYKNVICLGLVVDENGEKMSKSKGNVINPWQIFDKYGADAFRWAYYSMGRYHQNKRLSFKIVEDIMNRFLVPYWNSFLYLQRNAEIKGYNYTDPELLEKRPALDQWIISRLYSTCKSVKNLMDKYEVFRSTQKLELFIEDLSNWFLRISKRRYGHSSAEIYKVAFDTLYEAILNLTIVLSPFIPFLSEKIYLLLQQIDRELNLPTVHTALFPEIDDNKINKNLEDQFEIVKMIIQNGRALRSETNIGIRQPLSELLVGGTLETEKAIQSFTEIIKDELNVKEIHFYSKDDLIKNFMSLKIVPNYSTLGKKFKGDLKENIDYLLSLNSMEIKNALDQEKEYKFIVADTDWTINPEDLSFEYLSQEDFCKKETENLILLLNMKLDQSLTEEGLYRQILRRIQSMRKDLKLNPKIDQIIVNYDGDETLIDVLLKFEELLKSKASIFCLEKGIQNEGLVIDWEISNKKLKLELIKQ